MGLCYGVYVLGAWLSYKKFNILIDLVWAITIVSSFYDCILGGIPKLGFDVHHQDDTRIKGQRTLLLVVSLGEGCNLSHPHRLHHHLGEILQNLK